MNYTAVGCWSGNILHSDQWLRDHWLLAGRIFVLLTLPASLRLYTQRGSATSMRAFKEKELERPCFFDTNEKNLQGSVCKWKAKPCDRDLKERFFHFLVGCLFIYFFVICISGFLLLTFFVICIFFYPHFSIRHPQVSGPCFTDTPLHTAKLQKFLNSTHGKILEW